MTTRIVCTARRAATALLVAFLLGSAVMTFTRGWIAALPQHDHLFLGDASGHHHTDTHHAHEGDNLSRALAALVIVATLRGVLTLEEALVARGDRAVISLSPLTAQADCSSFGAAGAFLAVVMALCLVPGARLSPPNWRVAAGQSLVPLAPPPRAA